MVSPKVVEKILKGQSVNMTELLPDSWRWEDTSVQLPSHRPPRCPVTEITVWVESFALMASVVIPWFPGKVQHMFQYLSTIVHASWNFEGTAWVSYDAAFWQQAAIHGSFDWGAIDPTLYNEAFTGWARIKARCSHCLSGITDIHGSCSCPLAPGDSNCQGKSLMHPQHRQGIFQCVAFSTVQRATTQIAGTHISVQIVGGAYTQHPNAHWCGQGCSNRTDPKPPDVTAGYDGQHYVAEPYCCIYSA